MNIQGKDAISRATVWTHRQLIVSSVLVLSIEYGWIEISAVQFSGISLKTEFVETSALVFLIFSCVSHLIHFIGDNVSRREWNAAGVRVDAAMWIRHPEFQRQLERLKGNYDYLLKEIEKDPAEKTIRTRGVVKDVVEMWDKTFDRVYKFDKEVARFSVILFVYVYVWYLALPISLGVFAIWKGLPYYG